jgi:hypothetical protein
MPFISSMSAGKGGRIFPLGFRPGIPQSVSLAINGAGSMAVTYTAPANDGRSTNYII